MQNQPKVAVVILNWNGKKFLEQFLPAVIEHSKDTAEIIVADNGSTDNSVAYLQNTSPSVQIIHFCTNLGFAGGYNEALKQIQAEYYVLLNSDVEVTPNWITPIIELMDNDTSIAACQPKIKDYNNRTHFEYAGAAGGFIDKWGYPFCRGRIFNIMEEDKGQYDDTKEVFWATGASMFIRAELFHKAGGFDSDFFAHMEEIDLCWRLKNIGYKIMYYPHATVYHVGGGTLPKHNPGKTYLNFRNNLTFLYKNLPAGKLLIVFAIRLILDGIAATKFLFTDSIGDFWAVKRAHFSFYNSFFKNIKKRRQIHKNLDKTKQNLTGIYQRSIVYDFFIRKIKSFNNLNPI